MNQPNTAIAYVIAAAAGMALWFAGAEVSGRREAWDSGIYWAIFYPAAVLVAGVLGYLFPDRPWRWAVTLFAAQFAAMVLRDGELGNLFPLGLVAFGVLALPAIGVAAVGSRMKKRESR